MKVEIVESAIRGDPRHQYLISYRINDSVCIDAGCVGIVGSPERQFSVRHVVLSHSHIDHLASLPVLIENTFDEEGRCVTIHASAEVLDCLRRDIFNDRVWPDFFRLSEEGSPLLAAREIAAGQTFELDGLVITAIAVEHAVPTLGFLIEDEHAAVLIPSDTASTDHLWEVANNCPKLKAVFLEASFPEELTWLASASRHLTPSLFAYEITKLHRTARVIAVHIKPRFYDLVVEQLRAQQIPNLEVGQPGHVYEF